MQATRWLELGSGCSLAGRPAHLAVDTHGADCSNEAVAVLRGRRVIICCYHATFLARMRPRLFYPADVYAPTFAAHAEQLE